MLVIVRRWEEGKMETCIPSQISGYMMEEMLKTLSMEGKMSVGVGT